MGVVVMLLLLALMVAGVVVAIGGGGSVVVLVERGGRHQLVQLRAAAGVEKAHGSLAALVGEHDSGDRAALAQATTSSGDDDDQNHRTWPPTSRRGHRSPAGAKTTPRADGRSPPPTKNRSDERAPHDGDNQQTATDLAKRGNRPGRKERNQREEQRETPHNSRSAAASAACLAACVAPLLARSFGRRRCLRSVSGEEDERQRSIGRETKKTGGGCCRCLATPPAPRGGGGDRGITRREEIAEGRDSAGRACVLFQRALLGRERGGTSRGASTAKERERERREAAK